MTLEQLQRLMHDVVKQGVEVDAGAAALGVDPARLRIYRNFTRTHVRTALELNLPMTRHLLSEAPLGETLWESLYEDYLRACPPRSWELNAAAEAFPAFLEAQLDAGRDGVTHFAVCLAAFEWAQFETLRHPATIPAEVDATTLNPTLTLLQQAYPVVPYAARWSRGERDLSPPAPADSIALLFRHPTRHHCRFYAASDVLLFAMKVAHDGLSAQQAAAASGQPLEAVEAALTEAQRTGLILRP
ncbi:MAG: putative DNA-binding domain-containing protein [Myxococcales bacterium]|nr:putative DNA-binding domain-containing protein [Myxococcales bacterium]